MDRGLRRAVAWLGTIASATAPSDGTRRAGAEGSSGKPGHVRDAIGVPGATSTTWTRVWDAPMLDTLAPTLVKWKLDERIAYLRSTGTDTRSHGACESCDPLRCPSAASSSAAR